MAATDSSGLHFCIFTLVQNKSFSTLHHQDNVLGSPLTAPTYATYPLFIGVLTKGYQGLIGSGQLRPSSEVRDGSATTRSQSCCVRGQDRMATEEFDDALHSYGRVAHDHTLALLAICSWVNYLTFSRIIFLFCKRTVNISGLLKGFS